MCLILIIFDLFHHLHVEYEQKSLQLFESIVIQLADTVSELMETEPCSLVDKLTSTWFMNVEFIEI